MTSHSRRLGRLFCCLLALSAGAWCAEPAKTLVSDIVYRADGTPASGTLVISWPAFITSESVFGKNPGANKKDAALTIITSALSMAEAVSNKDIVDVDRFRGGISQIIDGTVQCLNASLWAKAK